MHLQSLIRSATHQLQQHARLASMLAGVVIVSLWTYLRHITNGVNFDVVGQIGLADQWARGLHHGAELGVTNYLLKIPLYAAANSLHFLTPMQRLLALALLFNIVTFVCLFILFEKMLALYRIKAHLWLYLGMLWLASIAGNVFWLEYANSRNLEVVGGVLLIFLALRYLERPQLRPLLFLCLAATIVFFADSLQLYVCGVGISVFALGRWVTHRDRAHAQQAAALVGVIAFAWIGARLLSRVATTWLHVRFLPTPHQQAGLGLHDIPATIRGLITNTFDVFGANFLKLPVGPNTLRLLLGAIVLAGIVFVFFRSLKTRKLTTIFGAGLTIIAVNYMVYIASGQVLLWATSRYLIMVPLLCIPIVAAQLQDVRPPNKQRIGYAWLGITMLSSVLLLGGLLTSFPQRHTANAHIYATIATLEDQQLRYALASRETGITTTYFSQGAHIVLPMACNQHSLSPTDLFYDQAGFQSLRHYPGPVAIIVPANGIHFGEQVCSLEDVLAQFGTPQRSSVDPRINGTILIYSAAQPAVQSIASTY